MGSYQRRAHPIDRKPWHEPGGHSKQYGIDDQQEQAQREHGDRQGQQNQERSHQRIHDANHQSCQQGHKESTDMNPWHQIGDPDKCERTKEPAKE
ncbi:MAG TPA: hypothetical protein VFQ30_17930 [Ktedonobacteraceae bacterium]|nr:hypothetical protein [Ktedonobacteraceae bacterium]